MAECPSPKGAKGESPGRRPGDWPNTIKSQSPEGAGLISRHSPQMAFHQMGKGEGLSGKSAVIRAESTRQKNHVELSPFEDQNLLIENHGGPPSGIRFSHP